MKTQSKQKRKMVRVQVPLPEGLKEQAEEKAHESGFGSVQEVIRLFLAGFVKDEYKVGFNVVEHKSIGEREAENTI